MKTKKIALIIVLAAVSLVLNPRLSGLAIPSFFPGLWFYFWEIPILIALFLLSLKYSILRRFDVLLSRYLGKLIAWADVVYIPRFWFSAILLAKKRRKPVIVHLHDFIPICPLASLYYMPEGELCRKRSFSDSGNRRR